MTRTMTQTERNTVLFEAAKLLIYARACVQRQREGLTPADAEEPVVVELGLQKDKPVVAYVITARGAWTGHTYAKRVSIPSRFNETERRQAIDRAVCSMRRFTDDEGIALLDAVYDHVWCVIGVADPEERVICSVTD